LVTLLELSLAISWGSPSDCNNKIEKYTHTMILLKMFISVIVVTLLLEIPLDSPWVIHSEQVLAIHLAQASALA
jgi:hypothetical protein